MDTTELPAGHACELDDEVPMTVPMIDDRKVAALAAEMSDPGFPLWELAQTGAVVAGAEDEAVFLALTVEGNIPASRKVGMSQLIAYIRFTGLRGPVLGWEVV